MASQPKTFYTAEEYLAFERSCEAKHEYHNGEIFAMGRASKQHVLIVTNLVGELHSQLKERSCQVYSADLRVKVSPTGLYTYPDVMEDTLQLKSVPCSLRMVDIYSKIDFPAAA